MLKMCFYIWVNVAQWVPHGKRGKTIILFERKREGICAYKFILLKPIHHIQYYSSSQLPKRNHYKCQDGDLNDESIMLELVLLGVENLSHSSWGTLSTSIKLVQEHKNYLMSEILNIHIKRSETGLSCAVKEFSCSRSACNGLWDCLGAINNEVNDKQVLKL